MTLLSKGTQDEASAAPSPVHLGSPDDLPVDRRLVFFLRSDEPEKFPRDEKVEVAAADGSFHTTLALADGSLMLEDAKTAVGVVEPLARFGSSAFGPLRARVLASDGVAAIGWRWELWSGCLASRSCIVRAPSKPCTLIGTNLFLAASFAIAQVRQRHRCAAGVYRNPVERSPSGQWRALPEAAR